MSPASGSRARAASLASLIVDALDVQRRRAGDDDEEADHAGQHGADDHVDPLVAEVLDLQLLVDRVGLDEGQAPRRQRRADRRHGDEHRLAVERQARHDQALGGGAPVGVGEHARDHVGDEDRAEREQDVLDVAKKRVDQLAAWVAGLGTASVEMEHAERAYRLTVEWKNE